MPNWNESILLGREEHAFITGQTRCGKTHLAKEKVIPSTGYDLCLVDPKGQFRYPNCEVFDDPNKLVLSAESLFRKWFHKNKPLRFLYRPNELWFDKIEGYDIVYRYCYQLQKRRAIEAGLSFPSRGMVCYTDELAAVCQNQRYPRYLHLCYSQGAGINLRMVSVTQRPSRIPVFVMSESAKWYCFNLVYVRDNEVLAKTLPGYVSERFNKHDFVFYDIYESGQCALLRLPNPNK